jgi:2-amino-4-hydroxy-6-hydroxymethyldihydropteridine diphosphokinase
VYVGFGANLGNRVRTFYDACTLIRHRGYAVRRTSSLYDSEPWGGAEGGEFVNAVYELEPLNTPSHLLLDLLEIETELGRRRRKPLEARSCDLDLLLWQDIAIDNSELCVPHPRIADRKFVLLPLCELIADRVHPVLGTSFGELLLACADVTTVRVHHP